MKKTVSALLVLCFGGFPGCHSSAEFTTVVRLRVDRVGEASGIFLSPKTGQRPLILYTLTALDPAVGDANATLIIRSMEERGRWGNAGDLFLLRYRGPVPIDGELEPSRIVSYEKLKE